MPGPAPAVEPEPAPPSPQVEPEPVLPAESRQVEPAPPPVSAPTVHRKNKRGRRAYDIWQPMFEHLDMCVKERGRPFETYKEAADYGQEHLKQLGEQRHKESKGKGKDKGAAIPTLQTIQEKISKQRPDLVIG